MILKASFYLSFFLAGAPLALGAAVQSETPSVKERSAAIQEKSDELARTHRVLVLEKMIDNWPVYIILKSDKNESYDILPEEGQPFFTWASTTYLVQGLVGLGQVLAGAYVLATPARCNADSCKNSPYVSGHHAATTAIGTGLIYIGIKIMKGSAEHLVGHSRSYRKFRRRLGLGNESARAIARQIVLSVASVLEQRRESQSTDAVVSEVLISQAHFDLVVEQLLERHGFLNFELKSDLSESDSSKSVSVGASPNDPDPAVP